MDVLLPALLVMRNASSMLGTLIKGGSHDCDATLDSGKILGKYSRNVDIVISDLRIVSNTLIFSAFLDALYEGKRYRGEADAPDGGNLMSITPGEFWRGALLAGSCLNGKRSLLRGMAVCGAAPTPAS